MKMRHVLYLLVLFVTACFTVQDASAQRNERAVREQTTKYLRLLQMIDAVYVDTVDLERLTEDAIIKVLADLDPHSVYISRAEVEEANEPLEGGFFGIGIQFAMFHDTLLVVDVVAGGPSENVGLRAGDRIVTIDGENVAGIGFTPVDVRRRLKGPEGSIVEVGVRRGSDRFDFRVTRGKIPIHSIDAAYMVDDRIGYIKIARFAATTVQELGDALRQLQSRGMRDLIIDLQGNGGGFMGAAIGLADHLLDGQKSIVYTDSPVFGRVEEFSTPAGLFQQGRVAILIDGNSASASEIVAGAVQDWDRGLIVGRRSFGKGLVQRQFPLTDGSMVRLTVSHYYTPSGRCIQKPYKTGQDYNAEVYQRYASGELLSADSIALADTTRYYTRRLHRLVHGGGGIIPDIFVPIDTGINYSYFNRLIAKGVVNDYATAYIDAHRDSLAREYLDFDQFLARFTVTDRMVEDMVAAGEARGVPRDSALLPPVIPEIKLFVKSLVARDLWDMNELYRVSNVSNKILLAAVKALRDGTYDKAFE